MAIARKSNQLTKTKQKKETERGEGEKNESFPSRQQITIDDMISRIERH